MTIFKVKFPVEISKFTGKQMSIETGSELFVCYPQFGSFRKNQQMIHSQILEMSL